MRAARGLLVAALLALFVALPAFLAPQAAYADTYAPAVPAHCRVAVPTTVSGERVVVRVRVSVPATASPAGRVVAAIEDRGGRVLWRATARHRGEPLALDGPRLPRGDYVARARFTPDAATVTGCSDRTDFAVGALASGSGGHGALPDTGGPHLLVLLGAVGLVAAGGGLVAGARR